MTIHRFLRSSAVTGALIVTTAVSPLVAGAALAKDNGDNRGLHLGQSIRQFVQNLRNELRDTDDDDDRGKIRVSANAKVDVKLPKINAVKVRAVSDTSASIEWKTNENTQSKVMFGTTANYGSQTAAETTKKNKKHRAVLSGLSANTTYHFQVVATDQAGNTSRSNDMTFTTPAAVSADVTAPTISAVTISARTDHSATIKWTTNEPTTMQVFYGTTATYGSSSTLDTTLMTSHEVTLTGLSANTTYHYTVESKDSSGNVSASADATLTTAVDTTAPVISNLRVTNVNRTMAIVRWTTNESSTSKLLYNAGSTFDASTALSISSSALVKEHSMIVLGLSADTTYTVKVESVDASANAAAASTLTFTTH